MKFRFGLFELDLATRELRRQDQTVPLQPRMFATLRYLIEHRDHVVGRQELIDALWGGYQLNAVAVPWTINRVRTALGEKPHDRTFIETVRGHGYRFVADVRVLDDSASPARIVESSQPSSHPPPAVTTSERPFVGRALVIQQLTAALERASESQGRICLLSGEAGIGKTRCSDEFAFVARRRGLQVWVGRCFEHGRAPAFWPFVQVLRAACSDPSLHDRLRQEGASLLRELEPHRPNSAPAVAALGGDDDFWLLDRLTRWVCRTAKGQLRVIALEDLHCADESSLQALSMLAPLLAQSRMLVVATARDSIIADSGRSIATVIARLRHCEHMALEGLRSDDVQSYLHGVLGADVSAELGAAVHAKTAGNPLFLREVTHVVSAQYEREGRVDIAAVQLPAAVTEIISTRLRELAPATGALLDVAAVIGDEFDISVLARVQNQSASEVLTGLEAAERASITAPRPDESTHTFTHPLMREVLYASLSPARRAELHGQVGLALEALGLIDPPLNALAYHFHHAPHESFFARAAHYARLAGDSAMNALAYPEAAQCYAWALEAQSRAAPSDVAAACELLLTSALALALSRRVTEAHRQCERAIELGMEARLPDVLIAAARILRPSVWYAHVANPSALRALECALEMLPADAKEQRSRVYAQLATLPPYSLRLESCRKTSAEAVRLASDSNDELLKFLAQRSRLFGLCRADSIAEQLRVADNMLRFDQDRTWRWRGDALFARYHASLQRGDAAAAERALDAYREFASARRVRMQAWHCERLHAQRLLDAGMLDAAERRFEELAREAQDLHEPLGVAYHRSQRYAINLERTGKRLLSELTAPPSPAAWAQRLPTQAVLRIQFAIELGEIDQASYEFRELAADGFAAVHDHAFGLYLLVQLAGVAIELNEVDAMAKLRGLLTPHASLIALSPFTISRGCGRAISVSSRRASVVGTRLSAISNKRAM